MDYVILLWHSLSLSYSYFVELSLHSLSCLLGRCCIAGLEAAISGPTKFGGDRHDITIAVYWDFNQHHTKTNLYLINFR